MDRRLPGVASRRRPPARHAQLAGRPHCHAQRSKILVDSNVWIDYFRGIATAQTERLDGVPGTEPMAIGDLSLAEPTLDDAKRVFDLDTDARLPQFTATYESHYVQLGLNV